MRVWLDDLRPAPEGFVHVRSVTELVRLLRDTAESIEVMSFDHDLGAGMNGYDAIRLMADKFLHRYPGEIKVHSANPVGRDAIIQFDACVRRELLTQT